jgi:hypothetical protein
MEAVDKWHHTKQGYFAFGLIELALAYGFASWAIDSGQLWQYALAIILAIGGLNNWVRIFRSKNHER